MNGCLKAQYTTFAEISWSNSVHLVWTSEKNHPLEGQNAKRLWRKCANRSKKKIQEIDLPSCRRVQQSAAECSDHTSTGIWPDVKQTCQQMFVCLCKFHEKNVSRLPSPPAMSAALGAHVSSVCSRFSIPAGQSYRCFSSLRFFLQPVTHTELH